MIVTATQVTLYTDISASAGTITAGGLIQIVQDRINIITNNFFTSDKVYYQGPLTFDTTAQTFKGEEVWGKLGFLAGDDFYLYNSYRNDGYHTIEVASGDTIMISSASTFIAEPTSISILVSLVQWPQSLKYVAAQMVKYDMEDRLEAVPGVKSKTLGPYSVTYGGLSEVKQTFGYPYEIIAALSTYTSARLR